MNKIKKHFVFVLISLFILSCETETVIAPGELPENTNLYRQITITQTGNSTFNISSNESFLLNSRKISKIIIENKNSGDIQSAQAVYEQVGNKFKLKFNISAKLDTSVFYNDYTVKYLFINNSFTYIDSSLATFKYPYQTTELFTRWENVTTSLAKDIQDFDLVQNKIFFHPFGPVGLLQHTRGKETQLKFDYTGGDYIAVNEKYAFCDIGHISIQRYNLELNKEDISVNIASNSNYKISGIDIADNKLYVATNEGKIFVYDLEFNLEKTIPYSTSPLYYLTINNNIAYSYNYIDKLITRYDLTTEKFLDPIPLPSHDCEAIKAVDDMLFFTDYEKKIIGYFKLSELDI
jgi:hypothetical protein